MGIQVTISEGLAELLEGLRRRGGYPTLDAAAEALMAKALLADPTDDHATGHSAEELHQLLSEAEMSGPAVGWDAAAARAEVLRRYAGTRK